MVVSTFGYIGWSARITVCLVPPTVAPTSLSSSCSLRKLQRLPFPIRLSFYRAFAAAKPMTKESDRTTDTDLRPSAPRPALHQARGLGLDEEVPGIDDA